MYLTLDRQTKEQPKTYVSHFRNSNTQYEKMILHWFKELTTEKWRRQLHRNTLNYF